MSLPPPLPNSIKNSVRGTSGFQGVLPGRNVYLTGTGSYPTINAGLVINGAFSDTTTQIQTGGIANTPTAITFNRTDYSNGISIGVPTSRIVVSETGLYEITTSIQLDKSGGGTSPIDLWLRVDGNDVSWSASQCVVDSQQGETFVCVNFFVQLNAGQYIEMVFASPDSTMAVTSFLPQTAPPSAYTRPGIPSIILTMKLIA